MQNRREVLWAVRVCAGEVSSLFTSCGQGGQEWPLGANVKPHISYLWPLALEPTHGDHGGVTLCSLIGRVWKVLCILNGHLHEKNRRRTFLNFSSIKQERPWWTCVKLHWCKFCVGSFLEHSEIGLSQTWVKALVWLYTSSFLTLSLEGKAFWNLVGSGGLERQ